MILTLIAAAATLTVRGDRLYVPARINGVETEAVLDSAARRFIEHVKRPALALPRGVRRLRALVEAWFDWARHIEGGCLLFAAISEYDDRPGPLRDRILQQQLSWRGELSRAAGLAIGTGELLADTDPQQLAFELYSLALAVHHDAGMFGDEAALARGRRALERLLASYARR